MVVVSFKSFYFLSLLWRLYVNPEMSDHLFSQLFLFGLITNTLTTLRLLKLDMLLIMLHKEHKVDSQGTFWTRILKLDIHVLVLEMTSCLRLLKLLQMSISPSIWVAYSFLFWFSILLIHRTTWPMERQVFSLRLDSVIPCKMMQHRAISVWPIPILSSPRFPVVSSFYFLDKYEKLKGCGYFNA